MNHLSSLFVVVSTVLSIGAVTVVGQNVVDTRTLFIPTQLKSAPANVQLNAFNRSMMLQHSVATSVFELQNATLVLTNFPLPGNESATLVLERTHSVVDANTEIYTYVGDKRVKINVRPVVSYHGTINGDPQTMVSLHYSEGDLTGFIQQTRGGRILVGRDFSVGRSVDATPHTIADEAVLAGTDPLAQFVCGSHELPVDLDAAARKMVVSSPKGSESGQAAYLRDFTMAMVLREDIDSIMKARGQSDEEIAQYFIKVASSIAQVYAQELNAYLTISYFEKFTKSRRSGYINDGRNPGGLLNEFSRDWSSRMNSINRTVAHLYTAIRPANGLFVGGIAYLDGMCDKGRGGGYGVNTMYLTAPQIPGDPNRSNAFVWDVFVSAHEMGHNIGAYHTHSCVWNPPIDTCQLQSDGTDACFNSESLRRVVPGSIMSYCHLENGNSTPLTFGTRAAERMRAWIAASPCTPLASKPVLTITEPRGSDAFTIGERVTIRWVSARISTVNIAWGPTENGPWTYIVYRVNAADKAYMWTATTLPVTTFWFRVEDATNASVNDTSLATFSVTAPVRINDPAGGERLGVGSKVTVRWSKSSGVGNVRLEFSEDGASYVTLLAASTTTQFVWTIPNTLTEQARMRVTALDFPTAPSTSGAFAIGNRRFSLELPIEDSFLCKNQPNLYRWSSDFIPTIRIQYSTNNGLNWRNATQQSTIDASLGQVISRNVNMNNVLAGSMVQVRIIDAATEEELDTVNSLQMDSCGAMSVSDGWINTAQLAITAATPNPASSVVRLAISSDIPFAGNIVLISTDGRELLLLSSVSVVSGSSEIDVSLDGFTGGMYHIGLRNGATLVVIPLAIVR